MNSTHKTAKMAGLFYLLFILASVIADQFGKFAFAGAPTTVNHIINHPELFRTGIFISMFAYVLFFLAAWYLYVLLKPLNQNLALLFLLLNAAGFASLVYSHLNLVSSLTLLSGADYLKVIPSDQLQAQATLFVNLYKSGSVIAQIPFGVWLLPLGYLVLKSGFLPKILGILLIADFVAQLIFVLQKLLLPEWTIISYPCLVTSFIAEIALTLWLLIKGVSDRKSAADQK
jgi:hypothetical protein